VVAIASSVVDVVVVAGRHGLHLVVGTAGRMAEWAANAVFSAAEARGALRAGSVTDGGVFGPGGRVCGGVVLGGFVRGVVFVGGVRGGRPLSVVTGLGRVAEVVAGGRTFGPGGEVVVVVAGTVVAGTVVDEVVVDEVVVEDVVVVTGTVVVVVPQLPAAGSPVKLMLGTWPASIAKAKTKPAAIRTRGQRFPIAKCNQLRLRL
jgi:hypothetical protein